MGDFKFACPVCGQHITADTASSGSPLECPTCFRKLVVPQAPAAGDTKLILSASQASKPRPIPTAALADLEPPPPDRARALLPFIGLGLLLLCAGGAAIWLKHARPHRQPGLPGPDGPKAPASGSAPAPFRSAYPVPTNIVWTLDLAAAPIPPATVAGSVHGNGFLCEKAVLQGTNLVFRQGSKPWPPDLSITLQLFGRHGGEWGGTSIEITPGRPPPLPKVIMRWKDDQQKSVSHTFRSGYALKLVFGPVTNGRVPGRIYLGLPDAWTSFIAGTFEAEIREPAPPKPAPSTPPKPPAQ